MVPTWHSGRQNNAILSHYNRGPQLSSGVQLCGRGRSRPLGEVRPRWARARRIHESRRHAHSLRVFRAGSK